MTDTPRRHHVVVHLVLAAVALVPLLLTAPGRIATDTRPYLYLDPGEFVARARSVWDPMVHLGTVTHQNLGLIVPMGAWFWIIDLVDLPFWIGQRVWLGGILFAAAAGVLHLGRTMGWTLAGTAASAALYAFSPYLVQYATRTSVLLLPFAGLPWLLSLAVRALRVGGWRHPAAFALVVGLVGTVNATSLILVGLAPVLWLVHAVRTGDATARQAAATAGRIGILCLGASAWWIAGLLVQARHGIPVLTYTETIDQVATTSAAPEVARGLGYWVAYGREVLDPNVAPAVAYTQNPLLLTLTYLVPGLAIVAALVLRFRDHAFFVLLTVVGIVVGVGAYPVASSSLAAAVFRDAADTTAGLAMRSSTRAVPLVALGIAVFLGRAIEALAPTRRAAMQLATGAGVVALLLLPALWTGGLVDPNFDRPEDLPRHWVEAAAHLDAQPGDGAVLELPGIQFATYRWGTTYEPVTPGLVDRPVIAREQLPFGSPASADLLIALDRRLQEGVIEPEAIAPVARLLGAHWVLLRNDLAFERYVSVRPERLWHELTPTPPGLEREASFGDGYENEPDPRLPLRDEESLSIPVGAETPAAVELLAVTDPLDRLRTEPTAGGVVLVGDGEGVIDVAAAGLLDAAAPLRYATDLLGEPERLRSAVGDGAELVITDTARKRQRRWRSVRWGTGYTERADEVTADADRGDGDLEVFDDPHPESLTTVVQTGATVDASTYGGPFTLDPDARPALAVDGDPDTAWVVGPITDPVGASLSVDHDEPVATDRITVTQRAGSATGNAITEIDLRVDGGASRRVVLDERSTSAGGQEIVLDGVTSVQEVEVRIAAVRTPPSRGGSPVGLAEVTVADRVVEEVVVLPSAHVRALADDLDGVPLTYVLTRLRSDPAEPVRGDEERRLVRRFEVPVERDFTVAGTARIAADADAATVAGVLAASGPVVTASSTLPGRPANRPAAALDGDPTTAWQSSFRDADGAWLEAVLPEAVALTELDLTVVADGRHSVPALVTVTVDGVAQTVEVPHVIDGEPGTTRRLRIPLEPVRGRTVRLDVVDAETTSTIDYYTGGPITMPLGIAEVGLGTTVVRPETLDTGCRDDLLTLDGEPVSVRITGATSDALDGRGLDVVSCDDVAVLPGAHELRATPGVRTGLDLDRVVLRDTSARPAPVPAPPVVDDVRTPGPTVTEATVGAGDESWLVMAQSDGDAWHASADGDTLGAPVRIDGGFNGWRLPASHDARSVRVEWRPQRTVDRAIVVSGLTAVLALGILVATRRRRGAWQRDGGGAAVLVSRRAAPEGTPVADRGRLAVSVAVPAVLGLVLVGPVLAVVTGAAALAVALRPGWRRVLDGAAVAAWVAATAFIVIRQVIDPAPHDYAWMDGLRTPHWLAMSAIVLMVTSIWSSRDDVGDAPTATDDGRRPVGPGWLRTAVHAWRDDGLERPDPSSTRRFHLGSLIGGVLGIVLFAWLLTLGRFDFTEWQRVGDFYDAQAESWLDGRWDIAPETLGIERFESRGKSFMYQGPWPAIIRLPVAAVSDRFEGRLTQTSMTLGFALAVAAAISLHWRVRRLVRGAVPVSTREAVVAGVLTFGVTGGSALVYVASRAWVYHEAIVWGVAWSLVALNAVLAVMTDPSRRRIAWAAVATTLGLWSRSSVALGPVAALGLLAGGNVLVALGPRLPGAGLRALVERFRWLGSVPDRRGRVPVVAPMAAMVAPVAAYAAVNWIKFRTLFSIPFWQQGFTIVDPGRQEMLAQNDGTLFGLGFSPTTIVQYLRPDALDVDRSFPFVDFRPPMQPIGDVRFDLIDTSTSIPVSMTMLCLLTLVAGFALVRRRAVAGGNDLAPLRVPVLGGLAGALTIVPFGYIANRYLADAVPFLALGAFAGAQVLLAQWEARDPAPRTSRLRTAAVAVLVVGIAGATWVNVALALSYGRLHSPNVKDDVIAGYLDTTYDVAQSLGLDPAVPIIAGEPMPPTAPRGTLYVHGDCDALYLSDAMENNAVKVTPWNAVERTEDGGRWLRTVVFPDRPVGTREPLLSIDTSGRDSILFVEYRGGAGIVFGYEGEGEGSDQLSPTRFVPPGQAFTLDLVADPRAQSLQVWLDGRVMLETYYRPPDGTPVLGRDVVGRPDVDDTFSGSLVPLPERTGLCRELLAEAGR